MKSCKEKAIRFVPYFCTVVLLLPLWAFSQDYTYDCTRVEIDETRGVLTVQEQIAAMEAELFASIETNDRCVAKQQDEATAAIAGGGGSGGGAGSGGGTNGSGGEGIEGDAQGEVGETSDRMARENPDSPDVLYGKQQPVSANGAESQIIPPKDNDQIFCQILYEDIQKETNPQRKSSLIQEYKKYRCG